MDIYLINLQNILKAESYLLKQDWKVASSLNIFLFFESNTSNGLKVKLDFDS